MIVGGFENARHSRGTLEFRDFPAYRREKFVIQSRPGVSVLGYLLTPKSGKAPHPTIICVPGHGRGVDDIVGIDDKGRDRPAPDGYQFDFAIQATQHGMAAVAIEPMAFGCRRDDKNKTRGLGTSSCQPTAGAAAARQTMIGWRVYDVMRIIDWIETRSSSTPSASGAWESRAAARAAFSATLGRIEAAMISGY